MSDHLDLIRIKNLEDADTEIFQGLGSSGGGGGGIPAPGQPPISLPPEFTKPIEQITPGGQPVTSGEKKAFDMKAAWSAQQRVTGAIINFLSSLEPGENTDAGNIVNDYISLLDATKSFSASLDAFEVNRSALSELPMIWDTLNRQPSKDVTKWIDDAETWGQSLATWWEDGLGALYDKNEALNAIDAAKALLADATTEGEVSAAESALSTAEGNLAAAEILVTAAQGELPGDGDSPMPGLIELITIARALMTGNFVLVAIVLLKIAIPLGIDFIVKWIGGKLPNRKTPPTQDELHKIAEAIQDVALKDTIIKFGDNASLHIKGQLLEY